MKKLTRIGLVLSLGLAVTFVATGCATTESAQALVCPECKMVSVTRTVPHFDGDGNLPFHEQEVTELHHSCPSCQGALTTLFNEGKLHHKCSICAQSPFYCPITHG